MGELSMEFEERGEDEKKTSPDCRDFALDFRFRHRGCCFERGGGTGKIQGHFGDGLHYSGF